MATLRNLRNILEAEVSPEAMSKVGHDISDQKAVAHSKQLPFRFLAAYRELKSIDSPYVSSLLEALEKAVELSAKRISKALALILQWSLHPMFQALCRNPFLVRVKYYCMISV